MSRLHRSWTAWLGLLHHREPATSLAILRIFLGLAVLRELAAPVVCGVVPLLWLAEPDGGTLLSPLDGGWRFALLGGYSPDAVWTMLGVGIASSVAMVLGLGGRVAPFVALQCFVGVTDLNPAAGGSDDYLVANLLWLIVLSDSTSTGSLAAWWKSGTFWTAQPVAAWPRYLVLFQLVVMYFSTGLQKMSVHWVPWGERSALFYILQQPTWQRFSIDAAPLYPFTQWMTLAVWLWEVASPLLLVSVWWHRTADRTGRLRRWSNRMHLRSLLLAFGVTMHIGIFVMMDVGMFSVVSLSCYGCAFHHDELKSALHALQRRLGRQTSDAAVPPASR